MLSDKAVHPFVVAVWYGESVCLLPPGGQFIDDGNIQIAIDHQRQGTGDGSGGHHQHMGLFRFGGQGCALGHTEAVLFIGHHQAQGRKSHVPGNQSLCAYCDCDFSRFQLCADALFGFGAQ